jgi:hypothetical protein
MYSPITQHRKAEVHMPNFMSLVIPDKAIKERNLHFVTLLLNVKSSHTQHKQRLQFPQHIKLLSFIQYDT